MNGEARHYAFITDEVPRPGRAGHLALNHEILCWLARRGYRITIFLARPRFAWPLCRFAAFLDPAQIAVTGPGLLCAFGMVLAWRPRDIAAILARRLLPAAIRRRRRGGVDAVLGALIPLEAAGWIAARIARLRPDAVLVDTIFRAPVLREARLAQVPSVIVTHDVFHLRHAALSARGYRLLPARLTEADETALLGQADSLAAIQPEEAAILARMLPDKRVFVAAMPAVSVPRPASVRREADRLVFLGSDSLHNVDGLRWFIADIWPLIRARRPAARLTVCGTVCDAIGTPPDGPMGGIMCMGVVAAIAPVLHRAWLAIAPLLAGSGLKIKLLDYARHGLGVVATPVSVAGFDPQDAPFIVAGDAQAFATAVLRTLADPAAPDRLEAQARQYTAGLAPDRTFADLAVALGA